MENTKLFNYDTLLNYVRGNAVLAEKIQKLIIEELPKEMLRMEEALKNKEWEKLGSIAHKIKPNIQMCSSSSMYEFVLNLEKDGKNKNQIETIPARVAELKKNTEQLLSEMKENIVSKTS
jgi:HPt (histidine-containing phosphotransfer) domain-containing protein